METNPNYYAILTADVRYNKNLTANEKLLYAEITALQNAKGYCWASNEYFMELYDTSESSIKRWLKNLEYYGFITREYIYKEGSKEIKQRIIKTLQSGLKNELEVGSNLDPGGVKNELDNIIIINNNKNNNKTYVHQGEQAREIEIHFEKFWNTYNKKIGKAKAVKAFKKVISKYTINEIIEHTLSYMDYLQAKDGSFQFQKHPTTFLNEFSLEDDFTSLINSLTVKNNNGNFKKRIINEWEVELYGEQTNSVINANNQYKLSEPIKEY